MKTNIIINMRKTLMLGCLGFGLCAFASCDNVGSKAGKEGANDDLSGKQAAVEVQVDGNTLTCGDHVYTVNGAIDFNSKDHKTATATVTFTNIPSGYAEFEAVYNNLLGKSPQGAAAMIPMAYELYARDHAVGEKCLLLLTGRQTTVDDMVRVLKTKFDASQYGSENDQYLQRYLAAALLKGAGNKNAYTPEEPYTVEMCPSPNGVKDASLSGGTVYYLYILANGWDSFQRSVEIMQTYNSEYYKVFNCPATYAQCKPIAGEWKGLK